MGKAVAMFLRWSWEALLLLCRLLLLLLLTLLLSCRGREGRMLWKALQKVPQRQREPPLCKACPCQSRQNPHDISSQAAPQHSEETLLCTMEGTCSGCGGSTLQNRQPATSEGPSVLSPEPLGPSLTPRSLPGHRRCCSMHEGDPHLEQYWLNKG